MISENLQRIQESNKRISLNIANAYTKAQVKGATLPTAQNSDNLAQTIESIPQSSNDWQPEPDWFDIDSILENDTEDYPAKMIVLLTDGLDEMTFKMNTTNKMAKIKTSDGAEYTETATHNWDTSKDKTCHLGYKTRYYIVYFSDVSAAINYDALPLVNNFSILYMILKNLNLTVGATMSYKSWLQNNVWLESIKFINSTLTENNGCLFSGNSYLSEIDMSKVYIVNKGTSCFSNCKSLTDVRGLNIKQSISVSDNIFNECNLIKDIDLDLYLQSGASQIFRNCSRVQRIKKIDFGGATAFTNAFSGCSNLRVIDVILNIKRSGIDFSQCKKLTRDTVLRIKNACFDYSADTENVHNIKIGPENIAKLTDEEMAEWLQLGWTVS